MVVNFILQTYVCAFFLLKTILTPYLYFLLKKLLLKQTLMESFMFTFVFWFTITVSVTLWIIEKWRNFQLFHFFPQIIIKTRYSTEKYFLTIIQYLSMTRVSDMTSTVFLIELTAKSTICLSNSSQYNFPIFPTQAEQIARSFCR